MHPQQGDESLDLSCDVADLDLLYDNLTVHFRRTIDKHALMKTWILRGNDDTFMNKELQKAV